MYIISSTDSFATNLTLATFRMIMFLGKFYSIPLDFLLTDATFILLFLEYEILAVTLSIHSIVKNSDFSYYF